MISVTSLVIISSLMWSSPYILGALGGVISEKAGVVNIGIEGMMTIGAFVAVAVTYVTQNPWLGLLSGGVAGMLLALLHAIASITFKADQTISGFALNFIGPGLAIFFARKMFSGATTTKPVENKLPYIFGKTINVTIIIAVALTVIMWFVLYKTKWGLRIRAVGEHPAAADTLGVNVYRVRYACVLMSGFMAGMGGAAVTIGIESSFGPCSISGQGFIALAAVIFGKWKPQGAFFACLFFGFAKAIATIYNNATLLPSAFVLMMPYVLTIIVLVLFVGKSIAPKSDGVPYVKGER